MRFLKATFCVLVVGGMLPKRVAAQAVEPCCFETGYCAELNPVECTWLGGEPVLYAGSCTPDLCETCCMPDGTCLHMSWWDCYEAGGSASYGDSTCAAAGCEPVEACCLSYTWCQNEPPDHCLSGGGVPLGPGTDCATATCPLPEACCEPSGDCYMQLADVCTWRGDTPQGPGSSCSTADCTVLMEACCLPTGHCYELLPEDCQYYGGTPQGPGSVCEPSPCPPQACCFDDASCLELPREDCIDLGGYPQYPGLQCDIVDCLPAEACCHPAGPCYDWPPDVCLDADGISQGPGTDCLTTECPPEEACCFPSGSCFDLTATACLSIGGTPQGTGTDCQAADCPPAEACCLPYGSCYYFTTDICLSHGGTPQGPAASCYEDPCPAPMEACCFPDLSCLDLRASECTLRGGEALGPDTDCSSAGCTRFGACCTHFGISLGGCRFRLRGLCSLRGGIPMEGGTPCAEAGCGIIACCFPDQSCLDLTGGDCLEQGGFPAGPGSDCWIADCAPFEACCINEYLCLNGPPSACIALDYAPQGPGTICADAICGPLPEEACCFPDGSSCTDLRPSECLSYGRVPQGPGTSCETSSCLETEACCFPDGCCVTALPDACLAVGGTPQGPGVTCSMTGCEVACPTCPSDLNADGKINGLDVQGFIECMLIGSSPDVDCDCADLDWFDNVDAYDVVPFVDALLDTKRCMPDWVPPSPSPMTWEAPPTPVSTSEISMTAAEASDDSPPTEYFFLYWPGPGTGGNSRLYDPARTYIDAGLETNMIYTYSTRARDSADPRNYTYESPPGTTATHIETPTGISIDAVTDTSIQISAEGTFTRLTGDLSDQPPNQSGLFFEMTPANGTGANAWVQTQTTTVTGLTPGQTYAFTVKARNYVGQNETPSVGPIVQSTTAALLDIKPGSCPNPLNLSSHGYLPVAVMGTGMFDVTEIDLPTVRLSRADGVGGEVAPNEGPPGPHSVFADVATPFVVELCECREAEGDGAVDLSMKFKRQVLVEVLELAGLEAGTAVELVVSGLLLDGSGFATESDCIVIVAPPN